MHVTKKQKKTKNFYNGKLGIHPDHPYLWIEIQFCVTGGLEVIILNLKFHQNWLTAYQDMRGQNLAYCIFLPMAYTTACTGMMRLGPCLWLVAFSVLT